MDWELEDKIITFISQLTILGDSRGSDSDFIPVISGIISILKPLESDPQPKPEKTELMSLVSQIISVLDSIDWGSQPKPLLDLRRRIIQLVPRETSKLRVDETLDLESESQLITQLNNSKDSEQEPSLRSLVYETLRVEPQPEIVSLIHQLFSLVRSMNSKWEKLISLCPQRFIKGKTSYVNKARSRSNNKWDCLPINWTKTCFRREDDSTHFHCRSCNGENHKENEMAPVEIKHPLHPKHSLQLSNFLSFRGYDGPWGCYCCDEELKSFFYSCMECGYAMNIPCVEKAPVLSIDHCKWHEYTLYLFSRTTSLTCDVCALVDPTCPLYICPPCGFVVHQRCINLPRVIRISRHFHRISFTPSFDQENWSCKVCRRKIDKDYGGYSCIKKGCSFVAQSKCATQSNVWDGIELEGEPEDIEEEEEVPPFVRISDGIIQHFMHHQHHLRLDENTDREYDNNKQCQACITPIYFGNFYSCIQCDFILHETCANMSRKMYHPVHPHQLTLVRGNDILAEASDRCTTCSSLCTGFFYECDKEECDHFKLDVKCATISEPLVHENHMQPLFLTSKPGEQRRCSICNTTRGRLTNETFNCIESDFSLCFKCATLPQKVRYKHDKHMLSLSYGKVTSRFEWCEACETRIFPNKGFYMCDEYCCVTLHISCLIENDTLKVGSSFLYRNRQMAVLSNNEHMSRPICSHCKKRCSQRIVLETPGFIVSSISCMEIQFHYYLCLTRDSPEIFFV